MLELGQVQRLKVVNKAGQGIYLGDENEKVLLPRKQVPEGIENGDEIEVFLYKDSRDRIISTTNKPLISLGEIAVLEVKEVSSIGAFLDWGLEKDLLLPYKEQTTQLTAGDKVMVALYIDKSSRLCSTMKVYHYLEITDQYKKDDVATGWVYEIIDDFGAFVAVDNKYSGLIPKTEMTGDIAVGRQITARVSGVKQDGKIDLSLRKKAYLQMEDDAGLIMKVIEQYNGILPYNDKASPEMIKKDFDLSKNAFKRGVGKLLKEGKIEITDNSIKKLN